MLLITSFSLFDFKYIANIIVIEWIDFFKKMIKYNSINVRVPYHFHLIMWL